MTEYPAVRDPNRCPTHPGALLDDIFPDIGKTKAEFAELLGITRQHLHAIMTEKKPITRQVAGRLGHVLGNGAGIWLRMQANHDAWLADRDPTLKRVPKLEIA